MPKSPSPEELLSQLHAHTNSGKSMTDPEYQQLAGLFTAEVHGFRQGDVVDISDGEGKSDNMPMLIESIELVEPAGNSAPALAAVRIRGPIFCANPEFDGKPGEGTCRPAFGETFTRLN